MRTYVRAVRATIGRGSPRRRSLRQRRGWGTGTPSDRRARPLRPRLRDRRSHPSSAVQVGRAERGRVGDQDSAADVLALPSRTIRASYSEDEIDLLAVYCGDLDRCYLLPSSLVAGRRAIHLRLAPAKTGNGHALTLLVISEFTGAVAQLEERLNGIQEARGSSLNHSSARGGRPTAGRLPQSSLPLRVLPGTGGRGHRSCDLATRPSARPPGSSRAAAAPARRGSLCVPRAMPPSREAPGGQRVGGSERLPRTKWSAHRPHRRLRPGLSRRVVLARLGVKMWATTSQ